MAAELDYTTGRAGMAYIGEVPWHRDGTALDPEADLPTWRTAAGLDWAVNKEPIFHAAPAGTDQPGPAYRKLQEIPGHKALVRDDSGSVLSVVSDRYVPHQPKDVVEFFQDLISDFGFKMHTMGSLAGGKSIWALADTGDHFNLFGNDPMNNFLLLATSFDKSFATTAMLTNVRVVCQNTLSLSLNNASYGNNAVKASHRAALDDRSIKAELGIFELASEEFRQQATEMARYKLDRAALVDYVFDVFKADPELDQEAPADVPYPVRRCLELYQSGPGAELNTAKGTLWGAFNAITRYQDHESPNRGGNRWRAATFGSGATRKRTAWDTAGQLLAA